MRDRPTIFAPLSGLALAAAAAVALAPRGPAPVVIVGDDQVAHPRPPTRRRAPAPTLEQREAANRAHLARIAAAEAKRARQAARQAKGMRASQWGEWP